MTSPTALQAIIAEFGIGSVAHELRWFAATHLQENHPELDEIGSSDVSIHLAYLALHEPDLLRAEAQRLRERGELVTRIAASTGRSEADTLRDLQTMFGPADPIG